MIRILKTGNEIRLNFEESFIGEDGEVAFSIPQNVEEFKNLAIDTINWEVGSNVKTALGNTQANLSASNAKGITLIAKVLSNLSPSLDGLTTLEVDSYNKIITLATAGYADSQLLNNSLANVTLFINSGDEKISRILASTTIPAIIAILNE